MEKELITMKKMIHNNLMTICTVVLLLINYMSSYGQGARITVGDVYLNQLIPIGVQIEKEPIFEKIEILHSESKWIISGREVPSQSTGNMRESTFFSWDTPGRKQIEFIGRAFATYIVDDFIPIESGTTRYIDIKASVFINVIDINDLDTFFDAEVVYNSCAEAVITTSSDIPDKIDGDPNPSLTIYPQKWYVVKSEEGTDIISEVVSLQNSFQRRASSNIIFESGEYYLRRKETRSKDSQGNDIYTWMPGSKSIEVDFTQAEGEKLTWYIDTDNDGFGEPGLGNEILNCSQPEGYVLNNFDECIGVAGPNFGCPNEDYNTNRVLNLSEANENYILETVPQKPIKELSEITKHNEVIESVNYYDGLMRAKQSIGIRQSPNGKDIIQNYYYDESNRQLKNYLPYASKYSGGVKKFNDTDLLVGVEGYAEKKYYKEHFSSEFDSYIVDVNPYTETQIGFDGVSIGKQAAPGKDWAMGSGNEISNYQVANTTADQVYQITAKTTNNITDADLFLEDIYNEGVLFVNLTRDEEFVDGSQNHTTKNYVNKYGQTVLTRSFVDNEAVDTYNVYDEFGNLRFVIPPKVTLADGVSATELNELCYQYSYDVSGRIIAEKQPGKSWEFSVYNWLGQVILTQNSLQAAKSPKEWSFTKYDYQGRVAYTGIYKSNETRATLQENLGSKSAFSFYEEKLETPITINGTTIYYTNTAAPIAVNELYTINYYDDYNFNRLNNELPSVGSKVFGQVFTSNTKGLPTGSKVKVLETNKWTSSEVYYNEDAQVIYTRSANTYLNNTKENALVYDFAGKILKSRNRHQTGTDKEIVTLQSYTYDHAGRLLDTKQCIGDDTLANNCGGIIAIDNDLVFDTPMEGSHAIEVSEGGAVTLSPGFTFKATASANFNISLANESTNQTVTQAELISSNEYTELGDLKSKKVGNTLENPLQKIDYKRNIRGWLIDINNVNANLQTDVDNDLFALKINYNQTNIAGSKALYNGNISESHWKTQNDNVLRNYKYSYDALNRITKAKSNENDWFTLSGVTYDKMGNILTLSRNGSVSSTSSGFGVIDKLTYTYNTSNKLTKVHDSLDNGIGGFKNGANLAIEYEYDSSGNMIKDKNKGITSITYNYLNFPKKVVQSNGVEVSYVYDATGNKLEKKVIKSSNEVITRYHDNFVYKQISNTTNAYELEFINQPEGFVEANYTGISSSRQLENFTYVYQHKDHLGNIRLSYADTNSDGVITAATEIRQEKHYYPFGLQQTYSPTDLRSIVRADHNYGYNGIELNNDLNFYEMPLRSYDPAIARWTTMDPVIHYNYSPYSAFDNNPVYWADPSGANSWGGDGFGGFGSSQTFVDNYWSNNGPQWTQEANYNQSQQRADSFFARSNGGYGNSQESIYGGNTGSLVSRIIGLSAPNSRTLWTNNGATTRSGFGFTNSRGGFAGVFDSANDFKGLTVNGLLERGIGSLVFPDGEAYSIKGITISDGGSFARNRRARWAHAWKGWSSWEPGSLGSDVMHFASAAIRETILSVAVGGILEGYSFVSNSIRTTNAAKGSNVVYTSVSKGVTQYAGITNNFARRSAEHLASKGINIQPLMKGLSRADARSVEQALIEIHGLGKNGGTLLNKINSISPKNPIYGESLQRGYQLLKSIGY